MIWPFNKIQKSLSNRLDIKVCREVRTSFEMITVEQKQGLFNHSCFHNAVQYVEENNYCEIYEIIYIDRGDPILHYVNYDINTKTYLETTLGYYSKNLEYYKIKKIHPNDYQYICDEFDRTLSYWNDKYIKWYHKFFGIERIL